MKGRKPKPTALKLLRGEKNKDRINLKEPKPPPVKPSCPQALGKEARKEWRRSAKMLERMGCLKQADKAVFAAYCTAWGIFVKANEKVEQFGPLIVTKNKNIIQNPALSVMNRAMQDMVKYGVELGMTPSSRSRIHVSTKTEKDELEDLLD